MCVPVLWVALTNLARLHQLRTQGGSLKNLEKFTLINLKSGHISFIIS